MKGLLQKKKILTILIYNKFYIFIKLKRFKILLSRIWYNTYHNIYLPIEDNKFEKFI